MALPCTEAPAAEALEAYYADCFLPLCVALAELHQAAGSRQKPCSAQAEAAVAAAEPGNEDGTVAFVDPLRSAAEHPPVARLLAIRFLRSQQV